VAATAARGAVGEVGAAVGATGAAVACAGVVVAALVPAGGTAGANAGGPHAETAMAPAVAVRNLSAARRLIDDPVGVIVVIAVGIEAVRDEDVSIVLPPELTSVVSRARQHLLPPPRGKEHLPFG
jgi:hypothetical protein